MVEHNIEIKNFNTMKQTPRRIPFYLQREVDKVIEEMRHQGVIEESFSPWTSPAVLIKKR